VPNKSVLRVIQTAPGHSTLACVSHLSVMPWNSFLICVCVCVCVCHTQVHSGRAKRSSSKKHDLICHPCPEGSLTHTYTHTVYAIHYPTNKITYTHFFPRDINTPDRSVGMTDLWAEMLFGILKRPRGKSIIV